MRLFIRICQATRIPYLAVHDRDAAPGKKPIQGERVLNAQIAELAGPEHAIELAPDFEAVTGLRGHSHKPARAWQRFSAIEPDNVPPSSGTSSTASSRLHAPKTHRLDFLFARRRRIVAPHDERR